jgi:hypothetical protein
VKKKGLEIWIQNSKFLLHDSTLAHKSLVIKEYLAKHSVMSLELLQYFSDLSVPDIFLCL